MVYEYVLKLGGTQILSIIFFISHFLGIRAETLRTTVVDFAHESMPTGEAFHLFSVPAADFILDIIAHEKVGADRIEDIRRI